MNSGPCASRGANDLTGWQSYLKCSAQWCVVRIQCEASESEQPTPRTSPRRRQCRAGSSPQQPGRSSACASAAAAAPCLAAPAVQEQCGVLKSVNTWHSSREAARTVSLAVLRIWTTTAGTMATRNATVTAAMDSHQGRSQVTCTQSMERCRAPTSRLLSAASAATSSPAADARLPTASPVGWSSATGCRIAALPPVESKRTWRSAKGSDCRRGEQSSRTRRAGPCDTAAALPRAILLNNRGTPVAGSPRRATSAPRRCPKAPTARAARRIRRDATPGLRVR